MATFKVGDRVRVIAINGHPEHVAPLLGAEGTITGIYGAARYPFCVEFNRTAPLNSGGQCNWGFGADELAPLTDPGADAFIERIKKLKPYEEPTVEPKRVPVIAPTAIYNGMTLACTPEGVFALRDGVWTKIEPR